MTDDNIPLLDDLLEKGNPLKENEDYDLNTENSFNEPKVEDLETQVNNILQRHTSQAVAEIMALVEHHKK